MIITQDKTDDTGTKAKSQSLCHLHKSLGHKSYYLVACMTRYPPSGITLTNCARLAFISRHEVRRKQEELTVAQAHMCQLAE